MKFILQFLCTHKFVCTYIYNTMAEWKCVKCGKGKKGFAPVHFTKTEMDCNNKYFKDNFNKTK